MFETAGGCGHAVPPAAGGRRRVDERRETSDTFYEKIPRDTGKCTLGEFVEDRRKTAADGEPRISRL
jgi:hypothetical protein